VYIVTMAEFAFLLPFVLVPAAILAFFPPKARLICLGIGVISAVALAWLADWASAHDGTLLLPLLGMSLGAGALLVEAVALPIRLVRRRHTAGEAR
jgi:hypothetical protein